MLINQLWNQLRMHRERGAIAVEYGVVVAFVVLVIAVALAAFGVQITNWLNALAGLLNPVNLFT